jgi:hypothetical protein
MLLSLEASQFDFRRLLADGFDLGGAGFSDGLIVIGGERLDVKDAFDLPVGSGLEDPLGGHFP